LFHFLTSLIWIENHSNVSTWKKLSKVTKEEEWTTELENDLLPGTFRKENGSSRNVSRSLILHSGYSVNSQTAWSKYLQRKNIKGRFRPKNAVMRRIRVEKYLWLWIWGSCCWEVKMERKVVMNTRIHISQTL